MHSDVGRNVGGSLTHAAAAAERMRGSPVLLKAVHVVSTATALASCRGRQATAATGTAAMATMLVPPPQHAAATAARGRPPRTSTWRALATPQSTAMRRKQRGPSYLRHRVAAETAGAGRVRGREIGEANRQRRSQRLEARRPRRTPPPSAIAATATRAAGSAMGQQVLAVPAVWHSSRDRRSRCLPVLFSDVGPLAAGSRGLYPARRQSLTHAEVSVPG